MKKAVTRQQYKKNALGYRLQMADVCVEGRRRVMPIRATKIYETVTFFIRTNFKFGPWNEALSKAIFFSFRNDGQFICFLHNNFDNIILNVAHVNLCLCVTRTQTYYKQTHPSKI